MSQILTENDDNRSVAASDFVQLDQADEVPNQQEEQPQFGGFQKNPVDWTMETGSTHNNYENGLEKQKLMIEKLEAKIETLQEKVENLELKAKIRAMEENKEQNAKYQALEGRVNEVVQMLSTQKKEHQKEIAQLKDGFAKEMTQFQAQFHSLEQKLKEPEQRAQMGKNQLEEIIQQKMEKFREEMDKSGQQAIGSNLDKLDFMWSQLMVKGKILANPNRIVWDGSKTEANISEWGLKATNTDSKWVKAITTEGYAISGEHCRNENLQFPGTIVFYYEVTMTSSYDFGYSSVGFTDGSKPAVGHSVGGSPNSYGIAEYDAKIDYLWLSGKKHKLECPIGPIAQGDVFGCGLLLNSKNELAVFFTLNGILLEKQIRINPTVNRLYPTVSIWRASAEANFGDNLVAKPFKFDTDKCPGLVFE